jgi:hypothetical protein
VDANGEAVIRGTIQPHGAAEATQYYRPRFRVWDSSGADNVSPFIQVGATDFTVQTITVGASLDPNNPTSIKGSTQANPSRLGITLTGVGSPPGGKAIYWYAKDKRTGKYFASRVYAEVPAGTGPNGAWSVNLPFWLFVNAAGNIEGLEKSVGQDADIVVEIYEVGLLGIRGRHLGTSQTFYVTAR